MTQLIDLTRPYKQEPLFSLFEEHVPLVSDQTRYTGVIYHLNLHSMVSTYMDLPGHIQETTDGQTAETLNPADFWRMSARVVHLSRASGSGAVSGAELAAGCRSAAPAPCLIINALGQLDAHEIDLRTVWLDNTAVDWIIASGCRVLISDIYESVRLEGVFQRLFKAGISTVCMPVKLSHLPDTASISIVFNPVPTMTQIPCRLLAEIA